MKLWWAIAAKLYINSNSDTMPQIAIAGYSGKFKTLAARHWKASMNKIDGLAFFFLDSSFLCSP